MVKLEEIEVKCPRCGHKYLPRKDKKIKRCPKCQHVFL